MKSSEASEEPHGDSGVVYSRFIRGLPIDEGWSIAVQGDGSAFITGESSSNWGFETTPGAYDESSNGDTDAFVAKFDPTGDLVYSTFIGGKYGDSGNEIAVDDAGNAYIGGYTYSPDFPTTRNALASSYRGPDEMAFVAKLNPSGSDLEVSTFIPGARYAHGIAVNELEDIFVAGQAYQDFPATEGSFDTSFDDTHVDAAEGFVAKLNSSGTDFLYAGFLGGDKDDFPEGIEVDAAGNAFVGGLTRSANFPTTEGAYDPTFNGFWSDIFVTKIDPAGSSILFSTLVGGGSVEEEDFGDIALGPDASVYVTGSTPDGFPVTPGAMDQTVDGSSDAFLTRLSPDGSALIFSTFMGGEEGDGANSVETDESGEPYMLGETSGPGLPVTTGPAPLSGENSYVAKFDEAGGLLYAALADIQGRDMAVDPAGTAYVTGWAQNGQATPSRSFSSSTESVSSLASGGAVLSGRVIDCTITGSTQADVLTGTSARDVICGQGGDDRIRGRGGNDIIFGGSGNDVLWGDEGIDLLFGNGGDDRIHGEESRDLLVGGIGTDHIYGGPGRDIMAGSPGADTLSGSIQADVLDGGTGADRVNAGDGPDRVSGGSGSDLLLGGSGRDRIDGRSGSDYCRGGLGPDRLISCERP